MSKYLILFLMQLFSFSTGQEPFNIDLRFPIIIEPIQSNQYVVEQSTLFSSIVATSHQNEHKLFLGSPNFKSNNSFISGAVFQCPFSTAQSTCEQIQISKNAIFGTNIQYHPTNKSLFGMNLQVTNKTIIICAPNWVGQDDTPEGICFSNDKFSSKRKTIFKYPRDTLVRSNRPYESHNLFGFSIAYNKESNGLLFGLPGFKDFSGAMCKIDEDFITTKIKMENRKLQTNSYTGYSVAFYSFDTILSSTPKFANFKGKVELIDINTQHVIQTFYSKNDTIGEFFGASLFVIDIENDGNAEIFVGAPLFSISSKQREVGRVYLFKDVRKNLFGHQNSYEIILSPNKKSGSRFGTNIASIDLNLDKLNDIIISAPFEMNNDRSSIGVIYIYYGSKQGLNIIDAKRISAESILQTNIFGFGFNLWTETDFDGNGYRDLAIGTLATNKAFILRTYPIININASMTFEPQGINFSDSTQCSSQNPCFRVSYCIDLDSHRFKFFQHELSFDINLTVPDRNLDLKEDRVINKKLNQTVKTKSNKFCSEKEPFYIELKGKEDIFDIITPIEVRLSVVLQRSETNQFCSNCPVANFFEIYQEIGFEHGCAHQYCLSQLVLTTDIKYGSIQVNDVIVEGQYNSLDINAFITNHGESSINTQMFVLMEPIHLNLIPTSDFSRCTSLDIENGFKCEINKLMITNQKEELILRLDTQSIKSKYLHLNLEMKTSSQIREGSQLKYSKNITIIKEAEFMLKMRMENHYNFSNFVPKVLFPVSIVIEKTGPSNIDGAYIQFEVPWMIKMEQPFQYRCNRIQQGLEKSSNFNVVNETLEMICSEHSTGCSKYQCKLNKFESGTQIKNFDITLLFISSRIKPSIKYKRIILEALFRLYSNDTFFNSEQSFDEIRPVFLFYQQNSEENDFKSKNAIIFGSAGLGILIILLTTIILIKYGFFKRKKLEELKRVQQRMSMNPNMFPIPTMMDNNINEINQLGFS